MLTSEGLRATAAVVGGALLGKRKAVAFRSIEEPASRGFFDQSSIAEVLHAWWV
jgi:hypothetical protein